MNILVAPTEPQELKSLGKVSSYPESQGADFFWLNNGIRIGVQRKEIKDFISSVQDGRLGKELLQMEQLDIRVLIVEGKLRWTRDGELVDGWVRLTKPQLRGALFTVQSKGVWVEWSENKDETLDVIRELYRWSEKDTHSTLLVRQGPRTDGWGKRSNKDWQIHILSSLPGIGAGLAEKIIDHFGTVPLQLSVPKSELLKVDGIGKQKVNKILEALYEDEEDQGQE